MRKAAAGLAAFLVLAALTACHPHPEANHYLTCIEHFGSSEVCAAKLGYEMGSTP